MWTSVPTGITIVGSWVVWPITTASVPGYVNFHPHWKAFTSIVTAVRGLATTLFSTTMVATNRPMTIRTGTIV